MLAGPGTEVAKKYEVRSFPVLLFVDAKGAVLCRTRGFKDAEDALALDRYVQAMSKNPQRRAQKNDDTCGRSAG